MTVTTWRRGSTAEGLARGIGDVDRHGVGFDVEGGSQGGSEAKEDDEGRDSRERVKDEFGRGRERGRGRRRGRGRGSRGGSGRGKGEDEEVDNGGGKREIDEVVERGVNRRRFDESWRKQRESSILDR